MTEHSGRDRGHAHLFILTFKRVTYSFRQLSQVWPPNKLHTHSGTWEVIAQLLTDRVRARGPPGHQGPQVTCGKDALVQTGCGAAALEPHPLMTKPMKSVQLSWRLWLQRHVYRGGTPPVGSTTCCLLRKMVCVCLFSTVLRAAGRPSAGRAGQGVRT